MNPPHICARRGGGQDAQSGLEVVMDAGRIVEIGTPAELIANGGLYAGWPACS